MYPRVLDRPGQTDRRLEATSTPWGRLGRLSRPVSLASRIPRCGHTPGDGANCPRKPGEAGAGWEPSRRHLLPAFSQWHCLLLRVYCHFFVTCLFVSPACLFGVVVFVKLLLQMVMTAVRGSVLEQAAPGWAVIWLCPPSPPALTEQGRGHWAWGLGRSPSSRPPGPAAPDSPSLQSFFGVAPVSPAP